MGAAHWTTSSARRIGGGRGLGDQNCETPVTKTAERLGAGRAGFRRAADKLREIKAGVIHRLSAVGSVRPASETTARVEAENAAWQAILDALPSAAIALDGVGTVIHHNAPVAELYPDIRVGQPISHVSRNPEFMGAVERIWQSSDPISVELVERVPLERRFFAVLSRIPARDDAKTLPQVLITFRDHSEQDKLAQMRADFIANASHELRTPLASLRGFVETLQGAARDDPAARDRFLSMMATQAARMTRLIDDLLSLSRAEMRVHLPPRGIVELNETCAFVIQTLAPLAEAARVTVTFDKLPNPALIRGERDEIVQVLQNLLQNAIKYGHEGGHVEMALTRENGRHGTRDRLSVGITDDGPGIAPQHLPRLTERFYRASVASSREKGGTGLGLAIVKHIVNRHRGELKFTSKVGTGSTFTVVFDALSADPSTRVSSNKKQQAITISQSVTK